MKILRKPCIQFLFRWKQFSIIFGCLLWVSQAQAASFDCEQAHSKVEKTICADGNLSELDTVLNAAYHRSLVTTLDEAALRQSQKQWLTERNRMVSVKQLGSWYWKRLDQLSKLPRAPMYYKLVMSKNDSVCKQALNIYNKHVNDEFPPPNDFGSTGSVTPVHAPAEIAPKWQLTHPDEYGEWWTTADIDWDGSVEKIVKNKDVGGLMDSHERTDYFLTVFFKNSLNKIDEKGFTGNDNYDLLFDKSYPVGSFAAPKFDQVGSLGPTSEEILADHFDVIILQGKAYITFVSYDSGNDGFEDWSQRKWRVISRYRQVKSLQSEPVPGNLKKYVEDICYFVINRSNQKRTSGPNLEKMHLQTKHLQ